MSEERTEDTSTAEEQEKRYIEHVESLRLDIRDEIKQRIKQRDTYSIQFTVALSALVAIAVTATATTTFTGTSSTASTETSVLALAYRVLIAAPLVAIYFTTLILYSYRVHKVCARYLRDVIEPELAKRCGLPLTSEWEHYYCDNAVPGIRRSFFFASLWLVTVGSILYVGFAESWQGSFMVPVAVLAVVYIFAAGWITRTFWES